MKHFNWQNLAITIVGGLICVLVGGVLQRHFEFLSASSSHPMLTSSITQTKRYLFSADSFTSKRSELSGSVDCWTYSIASPRADAYRCQGRGTNIYDPCFAEFFNRSQVVCPVAPWNHDSLSMRLQVPLKSANKGLPQKMATFYKTHQEDPVPSNVTSLPRYMWAVKLVNGVTCFRLTGASQGQEFLPVGFYCSNQAQTVGAIDTSRPLWTVTYFSPSSNEGFTVGIAEAWF